MNVKWTKVCIFQFKKISCEQTESCSNNIKHWESKILAGISQGIRVKRPGFQPKGVEKNAPSIICIKKEDMTCILHN